MRATDRIVKALLSCYDASFGGKYELAGRIEQLDELVQQGWVSVAECRDDPLSTHGAKSCRVLLVRMTEKGRSEAHRIAKDKLEVAGHFLKSLDSLPPRIKNVHGYLLKQWLRACENRADFTWDVRNRFTVLPLPKGIEESISKMCNDLVERGLATYASLNHNTSGPSSPTLMTCPEIHDRLLGARGWDLDPSVLARGTRTVVLDEYLCYLLNGLSLIRAKVRMLDIFGTDGKLRCAWLVDLSGEYGVSIESLWSWLEELEGCGTVKLDQKTFRSAKSVPIGPRYPWPDIVAYGKPLFSFPSAFEDVTRIEDEVKNKVEKWFETGEEVFQRFELKR